MASPLTGPVEIRILELQFTRKHHLMDPYVIVHSNCASPYRTKVYKGPTKGLRAYWNDIIILNPLRGQPLQLRFELWNKDIVTSDNLLASLALTLNSNPTGQTVAYRLLDTRSQHFADLSINMSIPGQQVQGMYGTGMIADGGITNGYDITPGNAIMSYETQQQQQQTTSSKNSYVSNQTRNVNINAGYAATPYVSTPSQPQPQHHERVITTPYSTTHEAVSETQHVDAYGRPQGVQYSRTSVTTPNYQQPPQQYQPQQQQPQQYQPQQQQPQQYQQQQYQQQQQQYQQQYQQPPPQYQQYQPQPQQQQQQVPQIQHQSQPQAQYGRPSAPYNEQEPPSLFPSTRGVVQFD